MIEDILDKDRIYSLMLVLSAILMDKSGKTRAHFCCSHQRCWLKMAVVRIHGLFLTSFIIRMLHIISFLSL